jgi:hypothetical protein
MSKASFFWLIYKIKIEKIYDEFYLPTSTLYSIIKISDSSHENLIERN